ncbi:MAG: hypothetical protein ACE5LV_08715 [Candidatus Aminicenantales bacterium]
MNSETQLLKEILAEVQETNRLLRELSETLAAFARRMFPQKPRGETISKGGPVAEITVYTPEKLEEWRSIFESRGLKVEFYEPPREDGHYFAKIWGYLTREDKED